MFEKRSRIVLACLVLVCLGMLLRAGQLQITQAAEWRQVAADALKRSTLVEATRGRLLDIKGEVLAEDVPCNDAAVRFWFVNDPPDPEKLQLLARDLARQEPGYYQADTGDQIRRVEQKLEDAQASIDGLWLTLAKVGGVTLDEVALRRRTVMDRIEKRRRDVIWRRFERAREEHEQSDLGPFWRRWLLGEAEAPPEMAEFEEPIADEQQAHVILHNISNEQYNTLLKHAVNLPPTLRQSLDLRASRTRSYPQKNIAAHVIGRITEVGPDDIKDDPELSSELRRYLPGDLIGVGGLESMAERKLRGTRGKLEHDLDLELDQLVSEAKGGQDVTTTLDAALSRDIRRAFDHVDFRWPQTGGLSDADRLETGPMPGAAVVIDLKTGAVLASVSAPDFDPNTFDDDYADLASDEINRPLVNRAMLFAAEPGSTVKPIVGLAAAAEGKLGAHETIVCDGYFHIQIGDRMWNFTHSFRCWTASMFGDAVAFQGHQDHYDPHPTPGLNRTDAPAGHISLADAIQRSCNVYFQTVGTRLEVDGLDKWFARFGLGRETEVGVAERIGTVPRDIPVKLLNEDGLSRWRHTWWASIGQGYVLATPMQMANVAATVARGGVAIRPTLLKDDQATAVAEQVNLGLDSASVEMVHRGMWASVHTRSGSGNSIDSRLPLEIAGKTGSAQASLLTIAARDDTGRVVLRENGMPVYRRIEELSVRGAPNPIAPWYRRNNLPSDPKPAVTHAWFIGFAPAENPTIAFAVLVEYGGSGGTASGSVAAQIVQALVDHGYLKATRQRDPAAPEGTMRYLID